MKTIGFRIPVRMMTSHARTLTRLHRLVAGALVAAALHSLPASAQQALPMRAGEAFVTRFSGTASVPGPGGAAVSAINPGGISGSVIDLRNPNQPPQGQHWIGEPQRIFVTAADIGQVFGIALDENPAPSIYLSATAAFGLHRTPDNAQWQPGMWGSGGGPGTIYRLGPATNYRPVPFAHVMLGGRPNSGAALGNVAYDRWNRQLYVSDLETGMIHRIRAADGADLGFFDHGMRGRSNFFDATTGQQAALAPVSFNPATQARIGDCPTGRFENSPECWNLAPNGRRVWGIGAWRDGATGEVRLYYAAWSSPAFDPEGWLALDDSEKRNSVWSVGIGADGSFNHGSIRREFLLPDFFVNTADIARAGFSQPVSDISFPASPGMPVMLVAERGGMRNLGLGEQNPFATPHESRVLRYELHQDGIWRPIGRYEIGFYDRANEGDPRMRANSAGGASFGPGYSNRWTINPNQSDAYVWISGDALCSPDGPCNLAASGGQESGDDSEVHGLQGLREDFYGEVAPAGAYGLAPEQQLQSGQTAVVGPDEAYLIDIDINMTPAGAPIIQEFVRNDATLVGDVAVFQQPAIAVAGIAYPLPPAPPLLIAAPGHDPNYSHARYGSHGQQQSHYRFASHWPAMSHNRYGSHNQYWSHYQYASHNLQWSHNRYGSHSTKQTHNKLGSHQPVASHFAKASKIHLLAVSHKQFGSHNVVQSLNDKIKLPEPKPVHTVAKSLGGIKLPDPKHSVLKSSLDKDLKLAPIPLHTVAKSAADKGLKLPEPAPVHSIVKSAAATDLKIPAPAHTVAKSAIDKDLKLPPPHSVAKSSADKGIKLPEAMPAHTVAKSTIEKDIKLAPKHDATKSAIDDAKLKVQPVQPAHTPAISAATQKLAPQPKGPQPGPKDGEPAKIDPKGVVIPKAITPEIKPQVTPKIEPEINALPKVQSPVVEPKVVTPPPTKQLAPQIQQQPKTEVPAVQPKVQTPPQAKQPVQQQIQQQQIQQQPKVQAPVVQPKVQTPPQVKQPVQQQIQQQQIQQQPKVQTPVVQPKVQTPPQIQQQPKVHTPPPAPKAPPPPKHSTEESAKKQVK